MNKAIDFHPSMDSSCSIPSRYMAMIQFGYVSNQAPDFALDIDYTSQQHRIFEVEDEATPDNLDFVNMDEQHQEQTWSRNVSLRSATKPDSGEALVRADATVPYEKQKTACSVCGTFLLRKTLPRHMQQRHRLEVPHKCDTCDRTFKRRDILQRHEREQHGDDSNTVECVYCGKAIKHRAMSLHFLTSKCIATRGEESFVENSRNSAMASHSKTALRFSVQFTMDSMDAIIFCSQFCATAYVTSGMLEENSWSAIPTKFRREYYLSRSRALRVTRKHLCEASTSLSWALAIFMMYCADSEIFGKDSPECEAHLRFLKSFRTTAKSLEFTAHAVRQQLKEVSCYLARSLGDVLKRLKCNNEELEKVGFEDFEDLEDLEKVLSEAADLDERLEDGHDGLFHLLEILDLREISGLRLDGSGSDQVYEPE